MGKVMAFVNFILFYFIVILFLVYLLYVNNSIFLTPQIIEIKLI